jgi:hypothetical protein
MIDIMTTCSKCGRELPPDLPPESCPNCLLSLVAGDPTKVQSNGEGSAPAFFDLPRAFGEYELVEEIARGGMGIPFDNSPTHCFRVSEP